MEGETWLNRKNNVRRSYGTLRKIIEVKETTEHIFPRIPQLRTRNKNSGNKSVLTLR